MLLLMTTSMTMFLSMIFLSSNPMFVSMMLLMMIITLTLMGSTILISKWFSFIIFIIYMGGIMILIMYIVSFISNEMFSMDWNNTMKIFLSMFLLILLILTLYQNMMKSPFMSDLFNKQFFFKQSSAGLETILFKMTSNKFLPSILFMSLLFVILIFVTWLNNSQESTMNF